MNCNYISYISTPFHIIVSEFINSLRDIYIKYKKNPGSINDIINELYKNETYKLDDYDRSNTHLIRKAYLKKLVKVWVNNLSALQRKDLTVIDMYFGEYDCLVYNPNNVDMKDLQPDGDKGCDIILNIILLHIIIKHLLIFITQNTKDNNLIVICNKIYPNFRCGLFEAYSSDNYVFQKVRYMYDNEDCVHLFFLTNEITFIFNYFNVTPETIYREINLLIPWILDNLVYIITHEMYYALDFYFVATFLNEITKSTLLKLIENDFNQYFVDMKNFKSTLELLTIDLDDDEIEINKRKIHKKRKIRNELIDEY